MDAMEPWVLHDLRRSGGKTHEDRLEDLRRMAQDDEGSLTVRPRQALARSKRQKELSSAHLSGHFASNVCRELICSLQRLQMESLRNKTTPRAVLFT